MANVVILGAGVMGSAISVPLTDNGHSVRLVGTHLDGDIIEQVHEDGVHPGLKVKLADAVSPFTHDRLDEAMRDADLIVLGVNSLGVGWAAERLSEAGGFDAPLLMVTKGLEGDGKRLHILPDVLRNGLPREQGARTTISAIGGPSIAGELAVGRHTCVTFAGPDEALLNRLADLLRTPYYHIWTTTDLVGVEVCVALKNVYALATGMVQGMLEREGEAVNNAAMHNAAAAIFAQGLMETAYLVEQMGGNVRNVYGTPGAGDLYVTCQGGRNSRMGRLLGTGMTFRDAKRDYMPNDTIEGAELALAVGPTVESMVAAGTLDGDALPLLRTMIDIVVHNQAPSIPWARFFRS